MRQRHQRTRDVFDTGPFGGYRSLGNTEGTVYYNGFSYTYNAESWSVYDSAGTLLETGSARNSPSNNDAAKAWIDSGAEPSYPVVDPFDNTGSTTQYNWLTNVNKDEIIYSSMTDVYYAQVVLEIITNNEAKVILNTQFDVAGGALAYWPGNWASGMENYDPSDFAAQFDTAKQDEKEAAYGAPETRTIYAPSMQFESRNVGVATKPGQEIPGTQYQYWDGDIEQHSWKLHGISTVKNQSGYDPVTDNYDLTYPEVMVDAMGSYGMCLSHYIARYNPEDASEFYGWEKLRASEAEGGVEAGTPIATVIQMFVKPGYDPKGRDWQDYFAGGNIMSEDVWRTFEKKPAWRFANGMKMTKESFFLLEPELAAKNKKPALTNAQIDEEAAGIMSSKYLTWKKGNYVFGGRMTDHVTMSALEKLEDVGYNGRKSIFKSGLLGTNAPKKRAVLDAEYGGIDIFGYNIGETNKKDHAAKVEWLGAGGTFGSFSKFPDAIADTNKYGKTMVVYRFPKQLDPSLPRHKEWLDMYAENGDTDYSIQNTKNCYPYPSGGGTGYAMLGRLPMDYQSGGRSDTIGDLQPGTIKGAITPNAQYGARMKIKFTPMIKPKTHPFGAYRMNEGGYGLFVGKSMNNTSQIPQTRTIDIRFDTTSVAGAQIAVVDGDTRAYFASSKIASVYFDQREFDVGSTGFAIGQCLLKYEQNAESIDIQLGQVYSSERLILSKYAASRTVNMLNTAKGSATRSHEVEPRPEVTGKLAGSLEADYFIPAAIITMDDVRSAVKPIGYAAIETAHKKIFGRELTSGFIRDLPAPIPDVTLDPRDSGRYVFEGRSFPFSILSIHIPGHYKGPILRYNEEGIPIAPTENVQYEEETGKVIAGPGFLGTGEAYIIYQSPFGGRSGSEVNFHQWIQSQTEMEEAGLTPGQIITDPSMSTGPLLDFTPTEDLQNEFMGKYEDEMELISAELLARYGNATFTNNEFKAYFRFWNKDYVTGADLINAGFPIPGIDYTEFDQRLAAIETAYEMKYKELSDGGNLYRVTHSPTWSDPNSIGAAGLGGFTDASGFTITDVTAKWGAIGSASPRYTGDVGMSMVPYDADVVGEEMGYMAMSNLDGLGYPGEGIVDSALDTSKDLAMEGAKWGAISVGAPIGVSTGVAVIMLAGTVAVGYMAKGTLDYGFKILDRNKPSPS